MSYFVNFSISYFVYCFKTISWASSFTIRSINSLIVPSLSLYYFPLLWVRCTVPHIILYCFFNEMQFTGYQGVCNTPLHLSISFLRNTRYSILFLHLASISFFIPSSLYTQYYIRDTVLLIYINLITRPKINPNNIPTRKTVVKSLALVTSLTPLILIKVKVTRYAIPFIVIKKGQTITLATIGPI